MPAQLNHTIVHARDALASATFLSEILGLPEPVPFGHFQAVATANGVSLDFISTDEEFMPQHYAFLIEESEFDDILARVLGRGLEIWADPGRSRPGEINTRNGRGFYFLDPGDNFMEVLTRPYETW